MEILLAAMIVGVIGVALAALTTAGARESGVGRTKTMLRNQLSLAMRQLRQDVRGASAVVVNGSTLTLTQAHPAGPNEPTADITYEFSDGKMKRSNETILQYVKTVSQGSFSSPRFQLISGGSSGTMDSMLQLQLVVEVDSTPKVNIAVDETFLLPHGIGIKGVNQ